MDLRGHRAVAIIGGLTLFAAAAAADDALPIKVQRRAHAGDILDVQLSFEQTRKEQSGPAQQFVEVIPSGTMHALTLPATDPAATAPGDGVTTTRTLQAELDCRVEVQDVNYRGETLVLITVKRFVEKPEGRTLVPEGKVIVMQADAVDASFTMRGGGEVSEEARTILREVYPVSYRLDDQSYGSKTPRKAGESWDVDGESVAQMDSNVQTVVDKASVKGTVTVVGPERSGTVPGVRLKIELARGGADRIRRPGSELFSKEQVKSEMSVLLPVDEKLPPLETAWTRDSHAEGNRRKQEGGGKVIESNVVMDTHTVVKQTIARADP